MSTVTIAEAREHLDELCDSVAETGEPVLIQRNGLTFMIVQAESAPPGDASVASPELAKQILGSPENERSLRESIARARAGGGIEMTVEELLRHVGMDETRV